MHSVLNTPSKYTYFYLSKNVASYNLCLFLKWSNVFSVSVISKLTITRWRYIPFLILIDQENYITVGFPV